MIFTISDSHFSHKNIIKHTHRPFKDSAEMDAEMIKRWNSVVGPDDHVFHLGDFTLSGKDKADYYFSMLNGHINVLYMPWHHDRRWAGRKVYMSASWHQVKLLQPMHVMRVGETYVHMSHYPLLEWDRAHYGAVHLHGHTHGARSPNGRALDVSADCINFTPITIEDAIGRAIQNGGGDNDKAT